MNRERWLALGAASFLAVLPVVLFFPALFSNKLIYGHDVMVGGVPLHAAVQRILAAHQWPLWMPDSLAGMPGIASCSLLFLYPSDLAACLGGLSLQTQLGLDAALHVALSGIGMFLFLRRLDRSLPAALLGAFFFALSGSQISQLYGGFYNFVEGIALVPWVFWAAHKGCKEGSWHAWGLCGLFFALQILAVAAQLFAYTLAAVAFFTLATAYYPENGTAAPGPPKRGPAACLPVLRGLALALGLAGLLSAPQLWLTLQYLPLAARHGFSYTTFISGSISLSDALTWVVPGFFGWHEPTYHGAVMDSFTSEYFGLLPWALAVGALAALGLRETRVRWMAVLAPAAFFFAQCRWTPFYQLLQHLPIVSGFRIWSRTLFLLTFAVCALAAFGWDALRAERTRTAALRGAAVFSALALAAAALAWGLAGPRAAADALNMPWLQAPGGLRGATEILTALARDSARTTLELIPVLLALLFFAARSSGRGAALALALAFHGLDQSAMFLRSVHFTDLQAVASNINFEGPPPAKPGLEPWRVFDPDSSNPNNAVGLGYENLYGNQSVPMRSTQRIIQAMSAVPGRRMDLLNLFNVRYIFRHSLGKASAPGDKVAVYENRNAFPRAWLVGQSLKVSGDEEACRLLADPKFDPRDEVALEVDAELGGPVPRGGVRWLARGPQAFSLAVSTDKTAALIVSNSWYPSWRAQVDGRGTPVLKADGGLQAVLVPAGKHQVDFRFDPGIFYDALAACLAGLAALFGLAFMRTGGARGG